MRKLGFVLGILCLMVIAWNADAATRPDAVGGAPWSPPRTPWRPWPGPISSKGRERL